MSIETTNITFTYPGGKSFSFPDLRIEPGGQMLLAGNSGTGKTTLLHIIAGILRPDTGTVMINQINIHYPENTSTDKFRGENIGLIFQKHFFLDALNMKENLILAQTLSGRKADKAYISSLMDEMGILRLADRHPNQLSQGELQRFSVARSLANRPSLILADEPTSGLDDENCARFADLLRQSSEKYQSALLVATHDARLKAWYQVQVQL